LEAVVFSEKRTVAIRVRHGTKPASRYKVHMLTEFELSQKLMGYMPDQAAPVIARWIIEKKASFRITRPRDSVYGDYMPPVNGNGHRISINGNQNKFHFLLTVIHEFAHLEAWEKHRERIKPHGAEWKHCFRVLMQPFFIEKVFPPDVHEAIEKYLENPAATSCSDENLLLVLRRYDRITKPLLRELQDGEHFLLQGKEYVRGTLRRKRYECRLQGTSSMYLISATAEVEVLITSPGE
jgi:hypothetical protein